MPKVNATLRLTHDGERLGHYCPGCDTVHYIPIKGPNAWTFNNDWDTPSLSPSIKHTHDTPEGEHVCHYFITKGRIDFCGDCRHDLHGEQDVPLPVFPPSYDDWND